MLFYKSHSLVCVDVFKQYNVVNILRPYCFPKFVVLIRSRYFGDSVSFINLKTLQKFWYILKMRAKLLYTNINHVDIFDEVCRNLNSLVDENGF